jgi:ubiquinol-cytochrome c reductase iron-sulfur subunit
MAPDAATVAAGAPIEVDLAPIAAGQIVKVFWRGKLIFVRHRTEEEIKAAQDANIASLRDPQPDSARVKEGKAEWLVVYGS